MTKEYPTPQFHFQVDWGGAKISFTEVTGLDLEREIIDYRKSDSRDFKKTNVKGKNMNKNITLNRGKFERNFDYNSWIQQVTNQMGNERRDITIRLLNEENETVAAWTATRCYPVKVNAPDLKADANEIAIESIEIAHEGLNLTES